MRELTEDDVTFTVECLYEDVPVRGNAMASGDDAFDKEVEDKIIADLEHNQWAWCFVCVTAHWEGFHGKDTLGCCSYESEEQFMADNGAQMRSNALDSLNERLREIAKKLDGLK